MDLYKPEVTVEVDSENENVNGESVVNVQNIFSRHRLQNHLWFPANWGTAYQLEMPQLGDEKSLTAKRQRSMPVSAVSAQAKISVLRMSG